MNKPLISYINSNQLFLIIQLAEESEEKQFFIDKLKEIQETINNIPPLYSQEDKGEEALYLIHYFVGGADWYISEISEPDEEGNIIAFGYADLGFGAGELGYSVINEIISVAEIDLHWTPKTLKQIKKERNL